MEGTQMDDRTQPSFVYVLGSSSGALKIGWSDDVLARLRALQGGHPVKIEVYAAVPFPRELAPMVERRAHELLSAHRAHDEWFAVERLAAIAAIVQAAAALGLAAEPRPEPRPAGGKRSLSPSATRQPDSVSRPRH
jgi:hypothetical protein